MAHARTNTQEPKPLLRELVNFDQLPDAANVRVAVVAGVMAYSPATVWRLSRDDPNFPKARKLGQKRTAWNVGEIRRWLASK